MVTTETVNYNSEHKVKVHTLQKILNENLYPETWVQEKLTDPPLH